jgi:hypothetical protein
MSIRFGVDGSHADYVVPVAIIKLYDEKGSSNYQTMYIRMGGTFSTAIRAAYDDAQGIMGTPFTEDEAVIGKLKSAGTNFLTGLQSQIVKGVLGSSGMLASAGQSGRQQIEFLSRVFLSNFQQVVYRGPSFRLFTLPFVMKPTSKDEAIAMKKIITLLKYASVPKVGKKAATNALDAVRLFSGSSGTQVSDIFAESVPLTARRDALARIAEDKRTAEESAELQQLDEETSNFISEDDAEFELAPASPITFGYPDVCEFELALYQPSSATLKKVFGSKKCVIESVVADYGSSNKMTFFEDGYYPTEVGLTLNLKELEFQTDKTIAEYVNSPEGYTML